MSAAIIVRLSFSFALFSVLMTILSAANICQGRYDKHPIARIDVNVGEAQSGEPLVEEYKLLIRDTVGETYTASRIRDAIDTLYRTKKIDVVTVKADMAADGRVNLLFDVKRKTQAEKVSVVVIGGTGDKVTEQELMFKLNLLTPGTAITEQSLQSDSDEILDYLRERGFFRSEVVYSRKPLQNESQVGVTFTVTPKDQAKVDNFAVKIDGYSKPLPPRALKLKAGAFYSRERLNADVEKVKSLLRKDKFFAPELDEPRTVYDPDTNLISIELTGKVGPTVNVAVDSKKVKVNSATQTRLLPIRREGSLDYAAIVEGERRLENYYQEQGYFFADVTPVCSSAPAISDTENVPIANDTNFLCQFLGGEDLNGRNIDVKYQVDLNRRLRLTKIRVKGTDKFTTEDITTLLGSQEASALGIVPILGYGRGYTSESILDDDVATIRSIMRELGYESAEVRANQGVSPNGEDLIITFVIDEGVPTMVRDVAIVGNISVKTGTLLNELPVLVGKNYSRARVSNAVKALSQYYSKQGYYDARVTSSVIETPGKTGADSRDVTVQFKVEGEGKKVVVNRILITGDDKTKRAAIVKALAFKKEDLLTSPDIYASEQNLYSSDAFSRVEIKPQPAGDGPDGTRLTDVVVSVEEQKPRLATYGGGYSTDIGLSGFFDIRHVNLFGNLWQGGARVKFSQRQQLVQFDFVNPRFIGDGPKRFAPLTLSVQYQRDSTVTRFFRSTFDRGTFGIVQRIDASGNAIDQFGNKVGDPTINRFSATAETSRTISRKSRSIVFARYRFEDVRLYKTGSLLVKDLLQPDNVTRISGFTTTFVRDTRQNCSAKYSLLDLIAKGDQSNPCRYNASDPTKGDYLTADYNISLPALGANVGFQKFQANYKFYYTLPRLRNTTLAAQTIFGVAKVFSNGNRFTSSQFPSLNGLLPISERFFAGGANTLRGFDFEEAGPRVVVVPQGTFIDSKRRQVFLDPFTIPFGGNALAVLNLEARIPISRSIRAVPFYDGGNVFRKAGDIFKKQTVASGDVAGFNQRAYWTHTAGLGLRIKTPIGGEFGIDYGHLLNPPSFLIPQSVGPNAVYRLPQSHIHFRFSQAF